MCNRGEERVECGEDRMGKPGREELDAYKNFEKKSSRSFLYWLCLAVMFQHSMEILGDTLEFDCLVCIADHCVTQEKLRDPWCPAIIGADSTIMTKSQPGKSQKNAL